MLWPLTFVLSPAVLVIVIETAVKLRGIDYDDGYEYDLRGGERMKRHSRLQPIDGMASAILNPHKPGSHDPVDTPVSKGEIK